MGVITINRTDGKDNGKLRNAANKSNQLYSSLIYISYPLVVSFDQLQALVDIHCIDISGYHVNPGVQAKPTYACNKTRPIGFDIRTRYTTEDMTK
jgi:hypothetical protein